MATPTPQQQLYDNIFRLYRAGVIDETRVSEGLSSIVSPVEQQDNETSSSSVRCDIAKDNDAEFAEVLSIAIKIRPHQRKWGDVAGSLFRGGRRVSKRTLSRFLRQLEKLTPQPYSTVTTEQVLQLLPEIRRRNKMDNNRWYRQRKQSRNAEGEANDPNQVRGTTNIGESNSGPFSTFDGMDSPMEPPPYSADVDEEVFHWGRCFVVPNCGTDDEEDESDEEDYDDGYADNSVNEGDRQCALITVTIQKL